MRRHQSSNNSKEQDILERQRQLAARIQQQQQGGGGGGAAAHVPSGGAAAARKRPSSSSHNNHNRSNKPKPPPPPPPPRQPSNKPRSNSSSSFSLKSLGSSATTGKPGSGTAAGAGSKKKEAVIDLTGGERPSVNNNNNRGGGGNSKKPAAAKPPLPSAPTAPTLKRATKKRPIQSSAALIAAARVKVSADNNNPSSSSTATGSKKKTTTGTSSSSAAAAGNPKESPTLKRKTLNKPGSLLLANLVSNVNDGDSNLAAGGASSAGLPTIQPDDFWKHLREWDFLGQYYKTNAKDRDDDESALEATTPTKKPLPDTFLNTRHYMAAWAPLCMAECRAQIVQDVAAAKSQQQKIALIPVKVKTTSSKARHRAFNNNKGLTYDEDQPWLQGSETGVYVVLQTKNPNNDREWSFSANDIVLLVNPQYKDLLHEINTSRVVRTAVPGKQVGDYNNCAMIGHVENGRNGINGLIVKVSARKWARITSNQDTMYLYKCGSNVTALREFTALTQTDLLPLKHFLLGHHLQQPSERNRSDSSDAAAVRKPSRRNSADELLNQMGGSQALGHGFISYARQKFNASQLTAIAASANEYGGGGFTLIKGPPGTGKTTTLVAVLNSLHIRQYNKYYEEVRRIAALPTGTRQSALENARKAKPRLLVCAPSNAAVDNIILKIMEDGFVDGQGKRYNPSMIRVGVGAGNAVRAVSLETKVDSILSEHLDASRVDASIHGYRSELSRITQDIARLRRRGAAILNASPWPLSRDWEIRVEEETFDETGRVYFVNHTDKTTTFEVPPPPEPGEAQFQPKAMPEYKTFMSRIVKLVESYFSIKQHLERCRLCKGAAEAGSNQYEIRRNLETHVLDSVHMVMTTLGTAGNQTMLSINKFEVVVVDEAAQSVEPATLSALHLGSRHAVLVGDPQQLPATIFNVSGRNSKYDRSLFQRLEEAGQPVYMLNEQYRMHPKISHFPRHIFYGGTLLDGPNVLQEGYGDPMRSIVCRSVPTFQPFTILDLDSKEERGGTSLSNFAEAKLAVYLYQKLVELSQGLCSKSRVAVITPYAQQTKLLHQCFAETLGPRYADKVEVNTVDAFQGREANVVIFSAVRAAGSTGIGFLSDVRRMNVALTRAKHFLFVIARCDSIIVNPYWNDLVQHARETNAVVRVPMPQANNGGRRAAVPWDFGNPAESWVTESAKPSDPRKRARR